MALMNDYALTLGIKYSYYNLCLHIPNDGENFCNNSRFLFSGIVIKCIEYTAVTMSMYETGKFIVYNFTVHCIVYSKLLILTSYKFTVH